MKALSRFITKDIADLSAKAGLVRMIASSQAEIQAWLRNEKDVDVHVKPIYEVGKPRHYEFAIFAVDKKGRAYSCDYSESGYESYEDALEMGLKEALEYVIKATEALKEEQRKRREAQELSDQPDPGEPA